MKQRLFQYGGLQVMLFESEPYGWVTTTPELAKGCQVDRSTLERLCRKHNLVFQGSVVEDAELGAKMHPFTRGPKPRTFWTVEGMTFVAMYLGTASCQQFRNEVLKTIKELEVQGFVSAQEVMQKISNLERMMMMQQEAITHLSAVVNRQDQELTALKQTNEVGMSAAGMMLATAKKTKPLRVNH